MDFSQYIVDEIFGQQQYVCMYGVKSIVMGVYQIIYKMFKGLKVQMGFDGFEKFIFEFQDKMVDVLFNNWGLKDFQNGCMSKKFFVFSFSQEWVLLFDLRIG